MIPVKEALILASLLFAIGIYGALTRKNMVGIFMSIELIFNSACLSFVIFTRYLDPAKLSGEIFVLFIISIAAAEIAIGLALLLSIYRTYKDVSGDAISLMKG
ncbi:MAG: NADH-quinone oxidoreductase subunit NuoK [Candidatus Omnitrophica bacterium]|nr:NADH-quinone oxidoreductase subunit NuoK [Candidatus Omnitrophota bacterium]